MSTMQAYHGSCHCGDVQYQIKLKFPPQTEMDKLKMDGGQVRLYKCNCTVCHKMGFFHTRPIDPANDFILTSPSNPEELGDYRTRSKKCGFYFCKNCGVRTFAVAGKWEQIDLDIDKWAGNDGGDGKTQKVWVTRGKGDTYTELADGKEIEKPLHYVSINAVTLEGVDLREWHEKKWIFYVENRERKNGTKVRYGAPHEGGMY